jgi:ribonuclease P/MRP protein subunit POP5
MVRFKNRYFLLEITLEKEEIIDGLSSYAVLDAIKDSIDLLFGEFGVIVQQSLAIKYYSPYSGMAIVRASREYHKLVWAAITFVKEVKNRRCAVQVVHNSGTIKLLQKYAIEYDTLKLKKIRGRVSEKKLNLVMESNLRVLEKLE